MNTLRDPFQSVYRHGHSTETVILWVKNDTAAALDNKGYIVLVMLDVSVASYTLNKDYLMNHCNIQSTIQRQLFMASFVHHWTLSKIRCTQRNISWLYREIWCATRVCTWACIYTRPTGDTFAQHGLQYHCYAVTHIYITAKHNQSITYATTKIEQWLAKVTD